MLEVITLCEGQTEKDFCNRIIAPHLVLHNIRLHANLGGTPHRKRLNGGIRPWEAFRHELLQWASSSSSAHLALLVDYYALPNCWPGRATAPQQPC